MSYGDETEAVRLANVEARRRSDTLLFVWGCIAAVLVAVSVLGIAYFANRSDDRSTHVDVEQTEHGS